MPKDKDSNHIKNGIYPQPTGMGGPVGGLVSSNGTNVSVTDNNNLNNGKRSLAPAASIDRPNGHLFSDYDEEGLCQDMLDSDDELGLRSDRRVGRRKIKIEFIDDKSRRHITFSKRKAGIMKKVIISPIILSLGLRTLYAYRNTSFIVGRI
jgi:hypothetical protein